MANMKRLVLGGTLGLTLSLGVGLPSAMAQSKIAYLDLNAVLEGTAGGKVMLDQLRAESNAKLKTLQDRMKALEEKGKQLQAQANTLKDEVKAERAQALAKEQQELQELYVKYQTELNEKKTTAITKFEEQLRDVVQAVAKRDGIDYVVRQESLLFGPPAGNLTNEIIREYDKRHPVTAAKGK